MGRETTDSVVGWLWGHLAGHQASPRDPWEGRAQSGERLSSTTTCDLCGRTLLTGEKTTSFRREDRTVAVCCLCEDTILARGFVRAA
jgi:hypothetical protein